MNKKPYLLVLILLSALVGGVIGAGFVERRISSSGTVFIPNLNLEAYWEATCQNTVDNIDWGTLRPRENTTQIIYLKNIGNTPLKLNLVIENWNPIEAGTHLSIAWNQENATIAENEVLPTEITMTVANTVVGISSYTNDIIILGSE